MKLVFLLGAFAAGTVGAISQGAGKPWEAAIQEFEHQDIWAMPPPQAYLFVGSSSIRHWESLAKDFPDRPVINRGFGGSQLSDVITFADRIIVPYQPKLVVVYCGDNDITSGHKSPGEVLAEFRDLVGHLHRALPHTPLAFITMKPAPSTWSEFGEKIRAGNQLIRDYIRTDSTLSFIDVFTPMLGADGAPRPELFVADREHLNPAGYALWTSIVKPYLK